MERLTYWNEEYGCWSYRCPSGDAAVCLAAYEDFTEKWKLTIDEMDAVFRRVNALGGTDLMAQYKAIGTPDQFRTIKDAEEKRQEGSDYCMGDVDSRPLLLESDGGAAYICGNGNLTVGDDSTEISVCPMCGRNLRGDNHGT